MLCMYKFLASYIVMRKGKKGKDDFYYSGWPYLL